MKIFNSEKEYATFFTNVKPMKLTESRYLKLNNKCWGILTDYFIESVKINHYRPNDVTSTAVLKVRDLSGQVTCVVKGNTISHLFGLSEEEWCGIEELCDFGQQLFFRYFRDGLRSNFSCEQKHFYNFCSTNQKEDVFIVLYCRSYNTRNKDKDDAFINIFEIRKANSDFLELYLNNLKSKS